MLPSARAALNIITRGLATSRAPQPPPLIFYVKQRDAVDYAEVAVSASASVSALKDAALAKLRLDVSPTAATLALATGGPPLDARHALSDAFDAAALALRPSLLLTLRAGNPGPPLPYRVIDPDVECEPHAMSSDADFEYFVRGHKLWAVTEKPDGGRKRTMVTNLASARRAIAAGAYLLLREPGEALEEDASKLKRTRKNADTSFEQHANKAITVNAGLRERYGELTPLNGGEGVVFVEKATRQDYASYDGLFISRSALLLNESKAHLCEDDVAVARAAHARLAAVVEDPGRFTSRPAEVVLLLEGPGPRRAVVPLLSSIACDAKTAAACKAARVHLLVRSGEGFECALAEGEFGGV